MDIRAYLDRIAYQGNLEPNYSLLRVLQQKHVRHIPFENLDIHTGKRISLNISRIYKKIIPSHRGGFCYEVNGLFFTLLQELGFKVRRISARVFSDEKGYGQEFDHLAIICTLDEDEYLVDAGFGAFALHPLKLEPGKIQQDPHGVFKMEQHTGAYLKVLSQEKGNWKPAYIFKPLARDFEEFEDMCHFHQNSQDSPFTQKRLCTLATETGRITLLNDKLKIKEGELLKEVRIENELDFHSKLFEYFHIEL